MSMIRFPLILVTITFIVVSAADNEALKKLVAGNLEFTSNVYKKLAKTEKGNFFFSGASAKNSLSLLSQGAKGATKTELQHGISETDDSINAYKDLLSKLNQSNDHLTLKTVNRIYAAKGFKILDSFRKISEDPYEAGTENVDFGDNTGTARNINNWVANQTNNKITDLISPNQLSASTELVLVNTLYFKDEWLHPFKEHRTDKGIFYTSSTNSKEIDMMHTEGIFNYRRCNYYKAQFLEIPFRQSNISIHLVLSNFKDGLTSLEPHIKDILVPHSMHPRKVAVIIPKFSTRSQIDFTPILKNLGVEKVFDRQQSDLTGISDSNRVSQERLAADFITQQTFINVTETGVEAAAATAAGVSANAILVTEHPPIIFKADHSFLYYIRDNGSGLILFVGKFTN